MAQPIPWINNQFALPVSDPSPSPTGTPYPITVFDPANWQQFGTPPPPYNPYIPGGVSVDPSQGGGAPPAITTAVNPELFPGGVWPGAPAQADTGLPTPPGVEPAAAPAQPVGPPEDTGQFNIPPVTLVNPASTAPEMPGGTGVQGPLYATPPGQSPFQAFMNWLGNIPRDISTLIGATGQNVAGAISGPGAYQPGRTDPWSPLSSNVQQSLGPGGTLPAGLYYGLGSPLTAPGGFTPNFMGTDTGAGPGGVYMGGADLFGRLSAAAMRQGRSAALGFGGPSDPVTLFTQSLKDKFPQLSLGEVAQYFHPKGAFESGDITPGMGGQAGRAGGGKAPA